MNKEDIREAMQDRIVWSGLNDIAKRNTAEMVIKRAYFMKGMQAPSGGEVFDFTTKELVNYLDKYYPNITEKELKITVDAGARGELPCKDTFVSISNIQMWIKAYHSATEYTKAYEELYDSNRQGEQPDTSSLNETMYRDKMSELYEFYCESGDIFCEGTETRGIHLAGFGEVLYDMMVERGHAVFFDEAKNQELKEEASYMYSQKKNYEYGLNLDMGVQESYYKSLLLRENFRHKKEQRSQDMNVHNR